MSSPISTWSDRRGLSQKGKEVHNPSNPTGRRFHETGVGEAVRRASISSNNGSPLEKVPTNNSSTAARRRSSASSGGLFNNLNTMKRGSQDYSERRASQTEMMQQGGRVSGWFNSTFRGIQPPSGTGSQQQQQQGQEGQGQQGGNDKRGVME